MSAKNRLGSLVLLLFSSVVLVGCLNKDTLLYWILENNGVEPLTKPSTSAAKVELGQALFFDRILSGNQNISCATCHHPFLATGDGLPLGSGEGGAGLGPERSYPLDDGDNPVIIPRNAPEIFNRSHMSTMFWDGRVEDLGGGNFVSPAGDDLPEGLENVLAVQACFPVTSRDEMRGHGDSNELAEIADDDMPAIWSAIMDRLLDIPEYVTLFEAAYPDKTVGEFTYADVANAIAEFEFKNWTLLDSPFDRFLNGDHTALNNQQRQGMVLFYGKGSCVNCHSGSLFTDEDFHNTGALQLGPGKGDGLDGLGDFGRERVTGDPADRYKFRTPPLRNVAATGPWTHAGAFTELRDVVARYNDIIAAINTYDETQLGPLLEDTVNWDEMTNIVNSLDDKLPDNMLTDLEIDAIVAFLESLSSPTLAILPQRDIPDRVPSGLPITNKSTMKY